MSLSGKMDKRDKEWWYDKQVSFAVLKNVRDSFTYRVTFEQRWRWWGSKSCGCLGKVIPGKDAVNTGAPKSNEASVARVRWARGELEVMRSEHWWGGLTQVLEGGIVTMRTSASLSDMRGHGKILNRGATWPGLHFNGMSLAAVLRKCYGGERARARKLLERIFQSSERGLRRRGPSWRS